MSTGSPALSAPGPAGMKASASALISELTTWESWRPLGWASRPSAVAVEAHPDGLLALGVAPGVGGQAGRAGAGRSHATLQRGQSRRDEQVEGDERRHRISRQPEHKRVAPRAKPRRLARLKRDAPEPFLHAQRLQRGLDVVVGADGDPAGDHHDVRVCEFVLQRSDGGRAFVRQARPGVRVGAGVEREADEHGLVGVVDLARLQGSSGLDELVAGAQDLDPGTAGDRERARARGHRGGELGRPQPDPRLEHAGAPAHVLARAPNVVPSRRVRVGDDVAVAGAHILLADDRLGAVG